VFDPLPDVLRSQLFDLDHVDEPHTLLATNDGCPGGIPRLEIEYLLRQIERTGRNDWKCWAWQVERTFPEQFSDKGKVESRFSETTG
jgi:hypothetical protein